MKQKKPLRCRGFLFDGLSWTGHPDRAGCGLEIHTTHAAHTTGHSWGRFIFWQIANSGFGRDKQTSNRSGILQGRANNLGRIDNAGCSQIFIFFSLSIETDFVIIAIDQLTGNNGTVETSILSDLTNRSLQGAANDIDTTLLIFIDAIQTFKRFRCIKECRTTTRNNTFLNSCAGSMQSIINAIFAFFNFDFSCTANFNHCNTAG